MLPTVVIDLLSIQAIGLFMCVVKKCDAFKSNAVPCNHLGELSSKSSTTSSSTLSFSLFAFEWAGQAGNTTSLWARRGVSRSNSVVLGLRSIPPRPLHLGPRQMNERPEKDSQRHSVLGAGRYGAVEVWKCGRAPLPG